MSREAGLSSIETQERTPGSLTAAISNLIVRLFSEYTGRGPNKARTTVREHVVLCVTQNAMTKGERRLVEAGEGDTQGASPPQFQTARRDDPLAGVAMVPRRQMPPLPSGP